MSKFVVTIENVINAPLEILNDLSGIYVTQHDSVYSDYPSLKGKEIRVKRFTSVYPTNMNREVDFSALTGENLDALREKAMEEAKGYYEQAQADMDLCAKAVLAAKLIQTQIERQRKMPVITHTGNAWALKEQTETFESGECSNSVYTMRYSIYIDKNYHTGEIKAYSLTWSVCVRCANGIDQSIRLAGQDNKKFKSRVEMEAYLAGRKKKYGHLFKEDCPPVPKKYAGNFSYAGELLPGYHLEEEGKNA